MQPIGMRPELAGHGIETLAETSRYLGRGARVQRLAQLLKDLSFGRAPAVQLKAERR